MNTSAYRDGGDEVASVVPSEQDLDTRRRLLRAGVEVFDRKGYDAASVREIVELAGVTKPALYYHFGSKEGLLLAILKHGARQFQETMARSLERPGTTRARVVSLCEDVFGMFKQHLSVVRVTHAVFLGPSEVAPDFDFAVFENSLAGAIEQIVREGQAAGSLRGANPADVGLAVMGVVFTVVSRQLHPRTESLGVEGLRRLLALVFDGVLREETNGQAAGEARQ
jgi:AcrR family transcriptional regulator